MQYILSENEYETLRLPDVLIRNKALELMRKELLKATGFTCIHDKTGYRGYCDDCPIGSLNRNDDVPFDVHELCCTLTKDYSK